MPNVKLRGAPFAEDWRSHRSWTYYKLSKPPRKGASRLSVMLGGDLSNVAGVGMIHRLSGERLGSEHGADEENGGIKVNQAEMTKSA